MHKNRPPAPRLSTALPITALVLSLGLGGCAGMRLGGSGQAVLGGYAKGDKVAVLLPGAGPLAGAADAIREGLRAARGADDTGAVPAVELIDSGDPAGIGDTLPGRSAPAPPRRSARSKSPRWMSWPAARRSGSPPWP
jgi:hypothetical protein